MASNYDKGADFDVELPISLDPPLIGQLDKITAPVHLVLGELDHPEVFRRDQFYMDAMPQATESVVEDSGHNMPLENPEGFLAAIRPFLSGLGSD